MRLPSTTTQRIDNGQQEHNPFWQGKETRQQAWPADEFLLGVRHCCHVLAHHGDGGGFLHPAPGSMARLQGNGGERPNHTGQPRRRARQPLLHRSGPRQPERGQVRPSAAAGALCWRGCEHEHSERGGVPNRIEGAAGKPRLRPALRAPQRMGRPNPLLGHFPRLDGRGVDVPDAEAGRRTCGRRTNLQHRQVQGPGL